MNVVHLAPTHVIFTTNKLIQAWNGTPVVAIDEEKERDEQYRTVVVLIDPNEATNLFNERNRYMYEEGWGVNLDDLMSVYANATSPHKKEWLPDTALIGTLESDSIVKLYKHKQWHLWPQQTLLDSITIAHMEDDFCACQSLVYQGVEYHFGLSECAVHGPYDPSRIESSLVNRRLTEQIASEFMNMSNYDVDADLSDATIYGYGLYPNGETGLYVSHLDNKFGHLFGFIPKIKFSPERWIEITDQYPIIYLERE